MIKATAAFIFLGNIHYDSRSLNFYKSFIEHGYEIKFLGFDWLTDKFKTEKNSFLIFKLTKKNSLIFYLRFLIITAVFLIKDKSEIFIAGDVYSLPLVALIGGLKKRIIVYDSREVYSHLAGLSNKKIIQKIITFTEKSFIHKAQLVVTTGYLDSAYIEKKYNLAKTLVIRNLPLYSEPDKIVNFHKLFNLTEDKIILLYQGVVIDGRGLKLIFDILPELRNFILIVVGDGEKREYYESLCRKKRITDQVYFIGKIKQDELINYTAGADVGLSLIENLSLSYYYALPNKLFEYILAGIPVMVSNFPQMQEIVENYKVGLSVDPENLESIKDSLTKIAYNKSYYLNLKENCKKASSELNWNKEIQIFFTRLNVLLNDAK